MSRFAEESNLTNSDEKGVEAMRKVPLIDKKASQEERLISL